MHDVLHGSIVAGGKKMQTSEINNAGEILVCRQDVTALAGHLRLFFVCVSCAWTI